MLVLTGPFIDDVAPPDQKTLWFGILYLFPTVGIAGGYIFGGVIGASMGWRMPFLIQVSLLPHIPIHSHLLWPASLSVVLGAGLSSATEGLTIHQKVCLASATDLSMKFTAGMHTDHV